MGVNQHLLAGIVAGGSLAPIDTSVRNIASGVRPAGYGTGVLSNGTDTTQNCRSSHHNESGVTLTDLALVFNGWYTDATNELIMPNDYTVTAAIEYPSGTYTQVTWSAATSKVIVAGTNQLSDYINIPGGIPANAQFWVRTFVSVSLTEKWPLCGVRVTALGEQGELGVALADKTMSGTISGSSSCMRPAAILSQYIVGIKKVSLAGCGDSIIYGGGDGTYDARGNTAWIGRAATGRCPYIPIAITGTTLANQVLANKLQYRLDFMQKCGITHIITNWGINDTAAPYATIVANLQTLWTALKTVSAIVKVYHCTLGPRSTTSFGYYNLAVQTPSAQFDGVGSTGQQVNIYIRTTPAPLNGYIENALLLNDSTYSAKWKTGDTNPDANLLVSESLTASGTPTTTNVPSNSAKLSNHYQFGGIEFLTGVLAGTKVSSGVNNTGSAITFSTPLASAPSAGDTFIAYPSACRGSNDGLHPAVLTNNSATYSGQVFGGHIILRDGLIPILNNWVS